MTAPDRIESAPADEAGCVERVARALYEEDRDPTEFWTVRWELAYGLHDHYRRLASAALSALRPAAGVRDAEAARDRMLDTAMRCLDRALGAMNQAVEITTADGPAEAMEFIADYLNNTDSIDEDVVDRTPDDWLDRWQVSRAAVSGPDAPGGQPS